MNVKPPAEIVLEAAFEAIADGICILNREGTVERCNGAFSSILKKPLTAVIGQTFARLAKEMSLDADLYARVLETRQRETTESFFKNHWWSIRIDPICKEGKTTGAVMIFTDVTATKKAGLALESANQLLCKQATALEQTVAERAAELSESRKALDSFCYTIAHDLKAPLRSIKGFTNILQEEYAGQFDETGKDYTRRIVSAVERMGKLIEDLLDYGRLSKMDLTLEPVDLGQEFQSVLMELSGEIQAKKADIKIEQALPTVYANPVVVKQVLLNLVSNALKFVKPDVVPKILLSSEIKKGRVRLSLKDNGIGIDPAQFERLFKVFERLHAVNVYPGSGVGLAVVRKGVEMMDGSVGVESALEKGSVFWIELPLPMP